MGIQFAKASGLTVIATASPHNFDYLRSLGADVVFDYHSPTAASDIRAYAGGKLRHAWDTIVTEDSTRMCAEAMTNPGEIGEHGVKRTYACINPVDPAVLDSVSKGIETKRTMAFTGMGEELAFLTTKIPPSTEDFEFSKMFLSLARDLLAKGTVKPIRALLNEGGKGLQGAISGLDLLRANKVSAGKLVYTLD